MTVGGDTERIWLAVSPEAAEALLAWLRANGQPAEADRVERSYLRPPAEDARRAARYRVLAERCYAHEGELEFDPSAVVSTGEPENGAYVMGWQWAVAPACPECHEHLDLADDSLLECGACHRFFHDRCAAASADDGEFICDDCQARDPELNEAIPPARRDLRLVEAEFARTWGLPPERVRAIYLIHSRGLIRWGTDWPQATAEFRQFSGRDRSVALVVCVHAPDDDTRRAEMPLAAFEPGTDQEA